MTGSKDEEEEVFYISTPLMATTKNQRPGLIQVGPPGFEPESTAPEAASIPG